MSALIKPGICHQALSSKGFVTEKSNHSLSLTPQVCLEKGPGGDGEEGAGPGQGRGRAAAARHLQSSFLGGSCSGVGMEGWGGGCPPAGPAVLVLPQLLAVLGR